MGNIDEGIKFYSGKQKLIHAYHVYHTKTNDFQLAKRFKDFEQIKKGALIGVDKNIEVKAPEDSYIIFALDKQEIGAEAFVLSKKIV